MASTEPEVTDDDAQEVSGPATAETIDDGRTSELRVRAGDVTVWMTAVGAPRWQDAEVQLVLTGRASRNLTGAASWVPDDGFGDARLTGKRTFEVTLRNGHEVNSILAGLPLFVHLESPGRQWDVAIHLGARFARFDGDARIGIGKEIATVYMRGAEDPLRYRGTAQVAGATAFNAFTDDDSDPEVTPQPGGWAFDWTYPLFRLVFDYPRDPVHFNATLPGGATASKRAGVDLRVAKLGLTRLGAETAWPSRSCDAATRRCVAALPAAQADTSACGDYAKVSRCVGADPSEALGAPPP